MANLKDLKNRINSVSSTQKITKAMKMVAASKLKRAQESVVAARPYAERMERVLAGLAGNMALGSGVPPLLVGTGKEKTYLIIVATSERGLCGGFNSSIVRAAKGKINTLLNAGKNVQILCIGKKGHIQLKGQFERHIIDSADMSSVRQLQFSDAGTISENILKKFEEGTFDIAILFYARFNSVLSQVVTEQQLIPATFSKGDEKQQVPDLKKAVYQYEPDEMEILSALLPRNVSVQLFRALLENAASEQGARMTAMDNATRNAGDMISQLTLKYNRTRQAAITRELIEIISGAEALKGA